MDHGFNGIGSKNGLQGSLVGHVQLADRRGFAGDAGDPLRHVPAGIAEIIGDDDVIALVEQLHAGMGADISGAAGH